MRDLTLDNITGAAVDSFVGLADARQRELVQALVRQYVGLEFGWDLQLTLQPRSVPAARLGQQVALSQVFPAPMPLPVSPSC